MIYVLALSQRFHQRGFYRLDNIQTWKNKLVFVIGYKRNGCIFLKDIKLPQQVVNIVNDPDTSNKSPYFLFKL